MRIVASSVAVQSTHTLAHQDVLKEWLFVRRERPAANELRREGAPVSQPQPQSREGRAAEANDPLVGDPALHLLMSLVESMTGRPVRVLTAADLESVHPVEQPPSAPDIATPIASASSVAIEFGRAESRTESETTNVMARGSVTTADGRALDFHVLLTMARTHVEETRQVARVGAPPRKDPLVLNLGEGAARLSDQRVSFDLDADGRPESVPAISGASAYLALDRNGNGRIDDGTELFGPATGAGLAELAAHDADRNAWIDENDPVFSALALWHGSSGGSLIGLAEAGVGAIALTAAASPFELKGKDKSDLGAVRLTGIYLREDGRPGFLQEIDLTV